MKSTYESRARVAVPVALVVVLAIGNILSNRVVPDAFYVPLNLSVAVVVLAIALTAVSPETIGLTAWNRGARWGAIVVGGGLALYLVALVTPGVRDLFSDSRVTGGPGRMLYETIVRIPAGTVVLEEVAFRGALPAVFARTMSTTRAVALASLLFGCWHVLPSLGLGDVNPVLDDLLGSGWVGTLAGVAFAVAGTFFAGLWLSLLRYGSGSLLAPVLVHIGTNSLGYAIAWFVGGGVEGHLGLRQ